KLGRELPHSLAVEVEEITDRKKSVFIKINIYVKRVSQKKIAIGRKGNILQESGRLAREEIENMYKKKIFLDMWVKVLNDWPQKLRILKKLGYWWL
ncbi:MAG: GTPase Era, partial [Candidatus Omnitrophica bacterium]|nr:GTPase Era [Candidatus Omnitrophota bacterium]MBD3269457.1 GTPase Era [Candidatus Omnitrophota bacterium]